MSNICTACLHNMHKPGECNSYEGNNRCRCKAPRSLVDITAAGGTPLVALIDRILVNEVKIETIRQGRYLVTIGGKGVTERNRKGDAELVRAEWLTYLSGIVVRTASACAAIIEGEPSGVSAASKLLHLIAAPLQELDVTPADVAYEGIPVRIDPSLPPGTAKLKSPSGEVTVTGINFPDHVNSESPLGEPHATERFVDDPDFERSHDK